MNPITNMQHTRASPLSDVLHLPLGVSKNGQGALHRLGAVLNEQGFSCLLGRVQVNKLAHNIRLRLVTWNIGSLTGKTK